MNAARPLHVLLVEDDEDDYVMLRDLLRASRGSNVVLAWAPSYEAALHGLACGRDDAYLIEFQLQGRSGLEFVREMTARGCTAPAIMLTDEANAEVDLAAIRAGAADFLVKPQVTASLLERSIGYAIERKRIENLQAEFVARVSHELRTPLTTIKGFTDLILEGDAGEISEDVREFLEIVKSSADGLMDVVNGMLDLTHAGAGTELEAATPPR